MSRSWLRGTARHWALGGATLLLGGQYGCRVESLVVDRGDASENGNSGGANSGTSGAEAGGGSAEQPNVAAGAGADFNAMVLELDDKPLTWKVAKPPETLSEMGGDAACPAEVPLPNSSCDVEAGTACQYMIRLPAESNGMKYVDLRCVPDGLTTRRWYEIDDLTIDVDESCPLSSIIPDSACTGWKVCPSPGISCLCYSSHWTCVNGRDVVEIEQPSEPIDLSMPIADLSAEQRATWCEWLGGVVNGEDESGLSVDADGYLSFEARLWYEGSSWVAAGCLPRITAPLCEANLALSQCAAPLAELTDCASTVISIFDIPSPSGCAGYLARTGCQETIVLGADLYGNRGCSIPVE